MISTRWTVLVPLTALSLAFGVTCAGAATPNKDDQKCLSTVASAVQQFTQKKLKALAKCRQVANPAGKACPDESASAQIDKAQAKMESKIAKKCGLKFDSERALDYAGCTVPGCTSAANYNACIACAAPGLTDLIARTASDGACGNGVVDAGEECDGGAGCSSRCRLARCGNGVHDEPAEECDATAAETGCTDGAEPQCVPAGLSNECTCVAACEIPDPRPTRLSFTTVAPSGTCGCTVNSVDEMTCENPSTKLKDLECGKLLVGGGLSAVPPGPTPDGATTIVDLPFCSGTELFIGGSEGTSPKNCSLGLDENGDAQCFFGPVIPVVNDNRELSACVLNILKDNLKGIVDAATGDSTMTVSLTSRTYLTGDLIKFVCRGGTNAGSPCSLSSDCTGGGFCVEDNTGTCCVVDEFGKCSTGSLERCHPRTCTSPADKTCDADSDCAVGATCSVGICVGGSNPGATCTDDTDCTGGTCSVNECPGETCSIHPEDSDRPVQPCPTCVDPNFQPVRARCAGGAQDGQPCAIDPDCPDGTCEAGSGTCNLGNSKGVACSSRNSTGLTIDCLPLGDPDAEDPELQGQFLEDLPVSLDNLTTGTATMAAPDGLFCNFGVCTGGTRDGLSCNNDASCPDGFCQTVCLGGSDAGKVCTRVQGGEHDDCTMGAENGFCGQQTLGAFPPESAGGPNTRRILEFGQAAGPIQVGDVKSSQFGAVFCIPRTKDNAVNNAASLPGPGATSLQGRFIVE